MEALQLIQNVIALKCDMLILQGGNLVPVFEDLLQASHINMVYHLLQAVGRQMLFQAGLWNYLGNCFSGVHSWNQETSTSPSYTERQCFDIIVLSR